jgi:hypothetical protein
VQAEAPDAEYFPAAQLEQVAEPVAAALEPAVQLVQLPAAAAE